MFHEGTYCESLLLVITSTVDKELRRARVLHFAGAIGFTFYQVARSLSKTDNFEYHIVEMKKGREAWREFFKDLDRLSYSGILLFTEEVSE